jgi:thiamine pyrophosphokinase
MDKYVLILAGGKEVSKDTLMNYVEEAELIIGVDKGAETALKYNVKLDLIIGDFDSINENLLSSKSIEKIKYPVDKDKTDLELALDYISKKNYDNILVLNALGNRIDHTLGNIFLLERYNFRDIKIIDDTSEILILDEKDLVLRNKKGYLLSIIPISRKIEIEKIEGAKYPLRNSVVKRSSTLCISNLIKKEICCISIKTGKAFIVITKNMEE